MNSLAGGLLGDEYCRVRYRLMSVDVEPLMYLPITLKLVIRCVTGSALATTIILALPAACVESPRASYERKLINTGKPALHAVHKERLRAIMADMSRLTFERLPQEMDNRPISASNTVELVRVAEALALDAKAIPDVLEDVRITPEDRRVFKSFADKLHAEAIELADLARDRRLDEVNAKMNEMISTCNACHSSFRVLPNVNAGAM